MHSNEYVCRVCGYEDGSIRWESYEEELIPHYLICDCCGAESGYQDFKIEGTKACRKQWLDEGAKWSYPKSKPANWNLEEQLKKIPDKYK
jgi:hypothetical protein